jgi:hypothetical protein
VEQKSVEIKSKPEPRHRKEKAKPSVLSVVESEEKPL